MSVIVCPCGKQTAYNTDWRATKERVIRQVQTIALNICHPKAVVHSEGFDQQDNDWLLRHTDGEVFFDAGFEESVEEFLTDGEEIITRIWCSKCGREAPEELLENQRKGDLFSYRPFPELK